MKTLQHVGHASTKWTLNGVALKKFGGLSYGKQGEEGQRGYSTDDY